jgi:ABC-type hemin transport system ATPase subunit
MSLWVVVGGQYGSEGKGKIAALFSRLARLRDGSPRKVLTEKTIEVVYGIRVRVEVDPAGGKP